jgi:anti-sigma factor RsiW
MMKPCGSYRKLMVWQTLNALDAKQARQLQSHLETCEGCRGYLAEISRVTERVAAAEMNSEVHASEHFHRQVAGRLRSARRHSAGGILAAFFRGLRLNERMAVPVVAVLVLACIVVATWPQRAPVASFPRTGDEAAVAADADQNRATTLANYQRVASRSLDQLDALLTRQGKQASPATPVYTASAVAIQ